MLDDPLIVWFNGGPGCSSFLGAFLENGPCIIPDGEYQIRENPYSWNKRANLLYLETLPGVGYATAINTTENPLNYSDEQSSKWQFAALQEFYKRFPLLLTNDLYITGESYAGIYVPYLSKVIYDHNQQISMNE